jgi:6-pyruvoyltetrahydropterin/6-carboxytetrahydropterin synthase
MKAVFEVSAKAHFAAAHWLRDYNGPCSSMHGHSFEVGAAVAGSELGGEHLLVDFHDLKCLLEEVIKPFDHACLNDLEPFRQESPTSENIARFIYRELALRLNGLAADVRLSWVSVSESPSTRVVYREEE